MTNINFYPQVLDVWQNKFTDTTVDSDTFIECWNPLAALDTCFSIEGIKFAIEKIKSSSFLKD